MFGDPGSSAIALMFCAPGGPLSCQEPAGGARVTINVVFPDFVVSCVEVAVTMEDPVGEDGAVYVAVSAVADTTTPRLAVQVTVGSKFPVP